MHRFFLPALFALTLPLLACAQEDLLPLNSIDVHELLQNYESPFQSVKSDLSQLHVNNHLLGEPTAWHECRPCIKHLAEHIVNGTFAKIALKCLSTKDPIWKKRCEWMHNHHNETLGYVVTKLHPGHQGYLYCAGAKLCPIHGNMSETLQLVDPTIEFENNIIAQSTLVDSISILPTNDTSIIDHDQLFDQLLYHLDQHVHINKHKHKCVRCMKKSTKKLMKHIIHKFKHYCKKTKCPKMKKICEWARVHKGFLKGSLYARIEPHKFAVGFCIGHGDCKKRAEAENAFFR